MSDINIKCKCSIMIKEEQFIKHFPSCKAFRDSFKNFDQKFGELLKEHSDPKENLLIIRILLKQYISVVENKIRKNFNGLLGFEDPEDVKMRDINIPENPNPNTINIININPKKMDIDINEVPIKKPVNNINIDIKIDPPVFDNNVNFNENFDADIPCCQICKGLNITYLNCIHPICASCFKNYALQDFPNMKCIQCKEIISEEEKKVILGRNLYEELENKFNSLAIGKTTECVNQNCKEQIFFEKGVVDYNVRDEKNQKLSQNAAIHYSDYRCRCPRCKIDFCVGCKSSPYHIGKNCEEHIKFVASKKCRYDYVVINNSNKGPADDVCKNPECIILYKSSCHEILNCGHKCFGSKNELKCPPCLISDCNNNPNIFDQNEDSYCNICFTEGLGNSPIVLLSCNHYIHHKCLDARLRKKWLGPKITFNHVLCPQCNKWLDCPNNPDLQALINESKILYDDICKKALERLKFEGLDKDDKLRNRSSPWYNKDLEFALHKISYYQCNECKKPYFAGLRECRGGPNDVENNNPNREYDPKDLICGAHANIAGVAGKTSCEKHGKDFIEYKCKFCCNIASWFCWGNTHFCEDCHARQCKGDYVSKYTKDKLPKCVGDKCNLKVKHPENGEEYALGCSVCRNHSDNVKDF